MPPRRTLTALVSALAVASGCAVTRPLPWTFTDPAPLGADEVRTATMREGGCADTDPILYFAVLSDRAPGVRALDVNGTYCFAVDVVDRMSCETVRSGALSVEVADQAELTVDNTLADVSPPRACEATGGTCVAGEGCLRCPGDYHLCDANVDLDDDGVPDGTPEPFVNDYCCFAASACEDPSFWVGDPNDDPFCVRIQ